MAGDAAGRRPRTGVPDGSLSAGEAARRLGVAVTTLRSWDRRYGLGPKERTRGRHRRYSAQDMARVELMRRLCTDGVAPAEAARLARDVPDPRRWHGAVPAAVPAQRAGHPEAGVRGLRRAAVALDAGEASRILRGALAGGVVPTWTDLICPALRDIGSHHRMTGGQVAAEHLLSGVVSAALGGVERPTGAPRILLTCADDEQHSLPFEALAAALAERGTAARMLGARVPAWVLHDAVVRTGPSAVLVWSHGARTGGLDQLRTLLSVRPRPALVAACGPGWGSRLPSGVAAPASLADALDLLLGIPGVA